MIKTLFSQFGLQIVRARVWAMQDMGTSEVKYCDASTAEALHKAGSHRNLKEDPLDNTDVAIITYKNEEVIVPVLQVKVDLAK